MRKLFIIILILFYLRSYAQELKQISEHFIVIGCDGMSPDGILNANTPIMKEMMKNGSYTLNARGVLPTVSSPNWASMLMGVGPEQHGITSNDWKKDDFNIPSIIYGIDGMFPTIFNVLKKQNENYEVGAIYHWDDFGRLFEKQFVDFDKHGNTEVETKNLAVEYIKNKKPNFLFVHFDHVDGAGHEFGHGTENYYKAVEKADYLIGEIINAVTEAGIFENTTFLVTADHGGVGFGHGGETLEELEIPFILYGNGVKKNNEILHPVYTYDNAATAAFVLGAKPLNGWIGKAVKSAFIGFENESFIVGHKLLTNPVIHPKKYLYEPAGGLFIDSIPEMTITTEYENAEIRYTLDGTEPTRNSLKYTNPVRINESCVVLAKVFVNDKQSGISSANFRITKSDSKNGINYKYFIFDKLSYIPSLNNKQAIDSGITNQIRLIQSKLTKENFAVSFYGYINILENGTYKFYTNSDDGSKLYIDNKEIVDNDGDHGTKERSGTINLEKGMHEINVIYFQGGGGSWIDVLYKGPGIPKQIIPPDVLFPKK
ncbi:MAG: alkaline phosphatase family protein [Ignavibacteriae bacterium]|nr:alkaline phosphatase family protein [Ignavibacteriota bacterium]